MKSFLPRLLATFTRQPRYDCDPKWDTSIWVVNIFRAWEKVFGRRIGIRAESSSSCHFENGEKIIEVELYTFEALLAHIEVLIREFFASRLLPFRLGSVQLVANPYNTNKISLPGVFFAIALNTATNGTTTTTSPITWSHTCTGSNLILILGILVGGGGSIVISTPTYNSANLTLVGSQRGISSSDGEIAMYYKLSPSTGSNTISDTFSGGGFPNCNGAAVSWSGVQQSAQPDAIGGITDQSGTNPSVNITTVADNCWVAGFCGATSTITAGLTNRGTNTVGSYRAGLEDTNAPKTPAGSQTVNWTSSFTQASIQAASFAPAATNTSQFMPFFRP